MTVTSLPSPVQVRQTVRGRNLLRLESIRRRLTAADPSGIGARRVGELCDALLAAGAVADPVLVDPRFGRWCAELTTLLDRDAAVLLPDGRFRAACRDAGALTLAVRTLHSRAGAQRPPATLVRVDHDGCVRLPGTGVLLRFGAVHAGIDVRIGIDRDGYVAEPPLRPVVDRERTELPGLVCAAPDPAGTAPDPVCAALCTREPLLTSGPPAVVVERGEPDAQLPAQPGIALVPAGASGETRAWYALAAAAQLRAELDARDLFEPGVPVPDPAPEVAPVIAAPQVVRLLQLYAAPDPPAGVGPTLALVAAWLAKAPALAPAGVELAQRLVGCGFAPSTVDTPGRVLEPVWRARWHAAGGALREPTPPVPRFDSGDPGVRSALAALGAAGGIEVNTLASGRQRTDPTIDHLSLLKARESGAYASVVAGLPALPADPAAAVLLGHQAYVEERFELAVDRYADVLVRFPYDIDLWRDFAFALRHLGAIWLCETTMFHLPAVVERAVTCELTLPVLDEVRPMTGEWAHAPRPVRVLVGLIEWIADDLDHR